MSDAKSVLVTGASSGIGKAIVVKLSGMQNRVLCVSRRKPEFRGADETLCADQVTWSALDLSNPHGIESYVESLGVAPIHALVLSAVDYGDGGRHPASATPPAEWQRVIATNLTGHCVLVSQLLPRLTRNPPGTIINISSDVAVLPSAGRAAYAASKAGLHAMLRAVEAENPEKELRVYQLIPTFQSVTDGIRRRRPAGFDFSSYAAPELIAGVVGRILDPALPATPTGAYLIDSNAGLVPYKEASTL